MQLAFTTADELFALLEQAGEVLDYREVWPHLFPITNCPPELMHTLMGDLVHNDERFTWEGDLHVGLTQWRAQRHDLADVVFTVVDLETTGSTPGFAKITEIGAVRVEGGREVDTFSSLVNARMTGCPRKSLNETLWAGVLCNVKPGANVPALSVAALSAARVVG